eukprot:4545887-Pleurochrysis_carterae.AAC.1
MHPEARPKMPTPTVSTEHAREASEKSSPPIEMAAIRQAKSRPCARARERSSSSTLLCVIDKI